MLFFGSALLHTRAVIHYSHPGASLYNRSLLLSRWSLSALLKRTLKAIVDGGKILCASFKATLRGKKYNNSSINENDKELVELK